MILLHERNGKSFVVHQSGEQEVNNMRCREKREDKRDIESNTKEAEKNLKRR